ncbi:MAG: hypothetical protein ACKVJK_13560 [Methylophagaceae bacterium]
MLNSVAPSTLKALESPTPLSVYTENPTLLPVTVVFVRDTSANAFKFYVNGTLVTTVSNAGSNIASTGSTFRVSSMEQ